MHLKRGDRFRVVPTVSLQTTFFLRRGKWTSFQGEDEMFKSRYLKRKESYLPMGKYKIGTSESNLRNA